MSNAKQTIETGKAVLGIEFGSTRIKAVLVNETGSRLHPVHMTGKTVWRMESGHTVWMISGRDLPTVMAD